MKTVDENGGRAGQNFPGGSACRMPQVPGTDFLNTEMSAELSDHGSGRSAHRNACPDKTGVPVIFHICPERCPKINAPGEQFPAHGFADTAFVTGDRSADSRRQLRQSIPSVSVGCGRSAGCYDTCEAYQYMPSESAVFPIFCGAVSVCGTPSESSGKKCPSEMTDRNRKSVRNMNTVIRGAAFLCGFPTKGNFPKPQSGGPAGRGRPTSDCGKQMPPVTQKILPYAPVSVTAGKSADSFRCYDPAVTQSGSGTAAAQFMPIGQIIKIIISITENCYNKFFC